MADALVAFVALVGGEAGAAAGVFAGAGAGAGAVAVAAAGELTATGPERAAAADFAGGRFDPDGRRVVVGCATAELVAAVRLAAAGFGAEAGRFAGRLGAAGRFAVAARFADDLDPVCLALVRPTGRDDAAERFAGLRFAGLRFADVDAGDRFDACVRAGAFFAAADLLAERFAAGDFLAVDFVAVAFLAAGAFLAVDFLVTDFLAAAVRLAGCLVVAFFVAACLVVRVAAGRLALRPAVAGFPAPFDAARFDADPVDPVAFAGLFVAGDLLATLAVGFAADFLVEVRVAAAFVDFAAGVFVAGVRFTGAGARRSFAAWVPAATRAGAVFVAADGMAVAAPVAVRSRRGATRRRSRPPMVDCSRATCRPPV